jgi:Flp pilus assembly protein TadD
MNYRVPLLSLLLLVAVIAVAQQPMPFPAAGPRGMADPFTMSTLNGSVNTAANQPVRDARVELRQVLTQAVVASGYTLPNGSFELTNVPPGAYEVVAAVGINEARERIEIDQPMTTVNLRLPGPAADAAAGGATVSVAQLKIPHQARKQYDKAEQAFHKQKFDQARERLQKALQEFPNYAQALTLRAILRLQDNQLDQARADLEHAIKADYGYPMAYIVLGATYNLMSRYDDSVRTLEHGIVLSPASWQAYFELSKALLGKGQFEAALRQVNKASALAPANFGAIHLVKAHALLGIKAYDQAVMELEQYLGTNPSSADSDAARQTLGQVRAFLATNKSK